MHRIFIAIYYFIGRNRLAAALTAVVFLFVTGFFASKITFEEDINQIIPKSDKSDLTAKVLSQLHFSDKIIVIIESKAGNDGYELSETADSFLRELEPLKTYIKSIQGKVDEGQITETFDFVNRNLPILLDENDYVTIENRIKKDSIAVRTAENYRSLVSPTSLVTKDFIKKDPLGLSFLGLQKLNSLNLSQDFRLENNYVVTQDGKNLLLFIEPKFGGGETENNGVFADKLNFIKDKINRKYTGKTEISYFGSPLIAVANAKQIKKDIQSTVLISVSVLLILLIFYFRNFLAPLIIFIPTVFGAAGGLMMMYFVKDRISAISLSVSAILIGITIDYAIHILTHYKHKNNIEEVFREITQPIIMSASTTAVSFLCLVFVRSEALRDLGIFASITVLLSAVFTLIIIPHLYKPKPTPETGKPTFIDKIGAYPYEKNKGLVIVCALLIIASFFGFSHIKFNRNIGDLNYVPEEMQANEKKLGRLSDLTDKSIHVVSYGDSSAEAVEKNVRLFGFLKNQQEQGKIISFSSVGDILRSEQDQQVRINRWNTFWTPEKKAYVLSELKRNGTVYGFNTAAYGDFELMLDFDYKPISISDYARLQALQLPEFYGSGSGLHTISTVVKIDEKNREDFINNVEKNNEVIAIDRQQLNENFLGLLKDDFNTLINYSLAAVILIFLLFFRNVDLTIMALIPIVLSGIVTAGILYFLGLELNIFSTIVCTLIFGAGVDFNIFLTQALQKELTTGKDQLPLYRVSIILALLTTVLAIGALVFAEHPALHSVSTVALVGMLAVVIISFAMYPLMFGFIKKRAEKGLSPVTFRVVLNSVFSLLIYGLGGFLSGIFGRFFIPKAHRGRLENIKRCIAFYLKTVLYSNPFVRKKVINEVNEDFKKPAVIIANHTSSLDTLAMALATHKIVYLVNDWVYHSPVFGKLVQALGFFPVSQGVEDNLQKLQQKVDEGFSLMVFPEAERSRDNNIKRFHKGAFYLAEQFNLDILPVYIHGNSEVMPKGEVFIFDGSITVKVGERISQDDYSFGKNYSERAKKINAFFRSRFASLRAELEHENYFRNMLFLSFHYKENELVSAVKKDFEENKMRYHQLNQWIGREDTVFHISDDFGQTDILLALQEAGRKIYSFNEDPDKRDISRQNYLLKRRKIFYPDTLGEAGKKPDVLLISANGPDFAGLPCLPPRIIYFNMKPANLHPDNYSLIFNDDNIAVFNIID